MSNLLKAIGLGLLVYIGFIFVAPRLFPTKDPDWIRGVAAFAGVMATIIDFSRRARGQDWFGNYSETNRQSHATDSTVILTVQDLPPSELAKETVCPSCKLHNAAQNRFCGGCGAELIQQSTLSSPTTKPEAQQQRQRFCTSCGAEMKTDMNFCPQCGAKRG